MEILKPVKISSSLTTTNSIENKNNSKSFRLMVLLYGSPKSFLFFSPFPSRVSAIKMSSSSSSFSKKRTNHLRKKLILFQPQPHPQQQQQPQQVFSPPPHIIIDNDNDVVVDLKPQPPLPNTSSSVVLSWNHHQVLLNTWRTLDQSLNPFSKQIYVFFAFLVFFSFKTIFNNNNNFFYKKQQSNSNSNSMRDNQMLSRKIKARKAKQKPTPVVVVVQPPNIDIDTEDMVKPPLLLDKQHLMNTILTTANSSSFNHNSTDFDNKIQQIRVMARHARDIEKIHHHAYGEDINQSEPPSMEIKELNQPTSLQPPDVTSSQQKGIIGYPHDDHVVSRSDVPNNNQSVVAQDKTTSTGLIDDSEMKKKSTTRIISSVQEAREYLVKKKLNNNKEKTPQVSNFHVNNKSLKHTTNVGVNGNVLINNNTNNAKEESKGSAGELGRANREKWMEDNFNEFEGIVEKIRGGFRNNYMVAKQKVKAEDDDDVNIVSELKMLIRETESEFEWMKDEKLREIVFQVRENELMGRDPFYLMEPQDKTLFFKGLEKKAEKENDKLRQLHEYLHSNIENLDYGADGISLYDPVEKIIPRWKGAPPAATTMSQELLDDYLDQRKALFAAETPMIMEGNSSDHLEKRRRDDDPQEDSLLHKKTDEKAESGKNLNNSAKTVIEGSDGSIKAGKKSGKEFWEHTKKWSRGFIDSYNAESDPETKAVMKDIGKDLERWITEIEIKDAADIVMDKVPDKGKKLITEKINRLKKEMELFGPQAVVSKYSEYGDDDDEQEIDYYWWLDLPFLLCIELYMTGDGEERIGFYSLEMASDLELDPKPHHIIAFEDAGDCKNLCYIIQAHLEMLGNGNAFVVPQPPKDTYREAKASGFNVTVIRKGELKLDVDQTLEEAEEYIVEIGSKIYHDKIMKDRNVDVDSLMKGVFGLNNNKRRRSKKRLKKPTK